MKRCGRAGLRSQFTGIDDEIFLQHAPKGQGISWTEVQIIGQSAHAGTTPMRMRHDPGYAAARIVTFVRDLTGELGGDQVATVGRLDLLPDLVNVVPSTATLTIDLRNTDEATLQLAERRLATALEEVAAAEGVTVSTRSLARFEPVEFDPDMIDLVEQCATALGYSTRRMPSDR